MVYTSSVILIGMLLEAPEKIYILMTLQQYTRTRLKPKTNFIKLLISLSVVVILGSIVLSRLAPQQFQNLISPLGLVSEKDTNAENDLELQKVVDTALMDTQGEYSVVVKDITTGVQYARNENAVYDAASLYKLWVMAAVYDEIAKGRLQETEVLSKEVVKLNEKFAIASESAEKKEGIITMTVSEAVTRMITISDNYAALLLSDRIGMVRVGQFLTNHGLHDSKIGSLGGLPTITAADTALFFEKLQKGELGNSIATENMTQMLHKQQIKTKMPKYLPKEVAISHKTGELGAFSHDAGIVVLPDKTYILVVLSETKNRFTADEKIARISEAVYTYFSKE